MGDSEFTSPCGGRGVDSRRQLPVGPAALEAMPAELNQFSLHVLNLTQGQYTQNLTSRQEQTKQVELAAGSISTLASAHVNELQALLQSLLQKYGTKTALAAALDISLERLIKVMKDPKESLGVLNCLRLAIISGLPPGQVLRLAGKDEEAELLERAYDRPSGESVNPRKAIAQWWPDLSEKGAESLRVFLDEVSNKKNRRVGKRAKKV